MSLYFFKSLFFLYVKTTLVYKKTFFLNFLLMKKCKIRNILCEKIITKQDVLLIKAQKLMEKLIMEYCWLLDIE